MYLASNPLCYNVNYGSWAASNDHSSVAFCAADTCPNNYGAACTACTCSTTSAVCSSGANGNGSCTCFTGFSGVNCTSCAAGYFCSSCNPCNAFLPISLNASLIIVLSFAVAFSITPFPFSVLPRRIIHERHLASDPL